MSQQIFSIGIKAKELMFKVLDATTCRNKYPVRFRRLSDILQSTAMDIYCHSTDANVIKADTPQRKTARFDLQTSVISSCDKFLSLAEYSYHAKLISENTCEKWTGLASDIKYMTLSWRNKTGS